MPLPRFISIVFSGLYWIYSRFFRKYFFLELLLSVSFGKNRAMRIICHICEFKTLLHSDWKAHPTVLVDANPFIFKTGPREALEDTERGNPSFIQEPQAEASNRKESWSIRLKKFITFTKKDPEDNPPKPTPPSVNIIIDDKVEMGGNTSHDGKKNATESKREIKNQQDASKVFEALKKGPSEYINCGARLYDMPPCPELHIWTPNQPIRETIKSNKATNVSRAQNSHNPNGGSNPRS
ncbi:hypothetical protein G9A89_011507 [Geosiphon pyriformis]|nr:hypothetical protein G9A89_011507 [Geosiphon pyriformis]